MEERTPSRGAPIAFHASFAGASRFDSPTVVEDRTRMLSIVGISTGRQCFYSPGLSLTSLLLYFATGPEVEAIAAFRASILSDVPLCRRTNRILSRDLPFDPAGFREILDLRLRDTPFPQRHPCRCAVRIRGSFAVARIVDRSEI